MNKKYSVKLEEAKRKREMAKELRTMGHDYKTIAEIMGIPIGTIGVMLNNKSKYNRKPIPTWDFSKDNLNVNS